MDKTNSKPAASTASGANSNSDTNSVNIYQTLEDHKNATTIILLLILAVLIINGLFKLYNWNKNKINKLERFLSRVNVNAV